MIDDEDDDDIIIPSKSTSNNKTDKQEDDALKRQESEDFLAKEEKSQEPLIPRRSKRGRDSSLLKSDSSDIFDLTNELNIPRYGKSRKKISNEIPVQAEIDLCDVISPNITPTVSTTKGKRGKKPKVPRKVSYKKALEILNVAIPDEPSLNNNPTTSNRNKSKSPKKRQLANNSCDAVDLTGDVVMTEIHNKNPLFQKVDSKSQSDSTKSKLLNESNSLDMEDDIDSTKIFVKINGTIKKYQIKTDQRFYDLFKIIAADEDVPFSNVLFFDANDRRILPEDTLDTIDHRISSIYTCRLMDVSSNLKVHKNDLIEIKFQSDKWKKSITLKVSRFEPFSSHIKLLCEQVNFKPEQFSLKFDGDNVEMSSSPIELEFEGGEIVDCGIKG